MPPTQHHRDRGLGPYAGAPAERPWMAEITIRAGAHPRSGGRRGVAEGAAASPASSMRWASAAMRRPCLRSHELLAIPETGIFEGALAALAEIGNRDSPCLPSGAPWARLRRGAPRVRVARVHPVRRCDRGRGMCIGSARAGRAADDPDRGSPRAGEGGSGAAIPVLEKELGSSNPTCRRRPSGCSTRCPAPRHRDIREAILPDSRRSARSAC